MTTRRRSVEIDAEAAQWLARLDRGPLDDARQAAFEAWLAADSRHLGAYARAQAVFVAFDRARALKAPGGVPLPARPAGLGRRAVLGWAVAAAAASVGGVLLVPQLIAPPEERYTSGLGQLRRIALSDGSGLTLGTATDAIVRFDADQRGVELTRGAALFDIATDAGRRFTVTAGPVSVTALGTSFSVEHVAGGGAVLVRHGVVAVARTGGPPVRLRAGQRATWSAAPDRLAVTRLDRTELRRELAWTEGMLAFEGRTMAEAAAEFSRYSDFRIIVADPRLAGRRVTGWFSSSDPRGFAHAVAASFGAVAEDRENAVIIRAAP